LCLVALVAAAALLLFPTSRAGGPPQSFPESCVMETKSEIKTSPFWLGRPSFVRDSDSECFWLAARNTRTDETALHPSAQTSHRQANCVPKGKGCRRQNVGDQGQGPTKHCRDPGAIRLSHGRPHNVIHQSARRFRV
jgi:hypothetical protein